MELFPLKLFFVYLDATSGSRSRKVKGNFLNVYSFRSPLIQALDKRQTGWKSIIKKNMFSKFVRDIVMKREKEFNGTALLQNFK